MGLINGSMTYRKFRISDELPKNFKETLVQELPRYCFRDINPATNPECSIGWVNPFDALDTNLNLEKVLFGKYIIVGMRKDTKSVSGVMLKAQLTEAVRAARRERRGKKLSREEMNSLKETVKEKLLATTSPSIALFEAVWNYETQEVYFSSQSQKPMADFMDLFEETFKMSLEEVTLLSRTENYINRTGMDTDLALLSATHFGQ